MHVVLHECDDQRITLTEPDDEIPCWWRETDIHTQDTACLWCGTSLDPTVPCLRFRSLNPEGAIERVYCCLTHAYNLFDGIIHHEPPEEYRVDVSEDSIAVLYQDPVMAPSGTQPCIWCGDTIVPDEAPSYAIHTSGVGVHEACGTPMATALRDKLDEALSEHADELLGPAL